jgi:hypothetical protein
MRRLRRRIPDAQAIAGFWGLSDDNSRFLDAFGTTEAEVVTIFQDALERIVGAVEASPPDKAESSPQDEPAQRQPNEAAA